MTTTETFREEVEKGLGAVVILAGSGSDEPHIEKIAGSLRKYGIPFEVRIASAHKQSATLLRIIDEYDAMSGPLTYVAVAGGTDALSGTVSYRTYRPVVSSPPDAPNQSCLTNPPGSSNATIYDPKNVGRFIAQMFSWTNREYHKALANEMAAKLSSLEADDNKLHAKFGGHKND